MNIPKIIHQSTKSLAEASPDLVGNFQAIQRLNSTWSYRLYDRETQTKYLRNILSAEQAALLDRINPTYGVVISDLFRYVKLFDEGGVYLDDKSSTTQPLDQVIEPYFTYVLSRWQNGTGQQFQGWGLSPELGDPRMGGEFQQWHIIARPRHPFLKAVIHRVLHNIRNYSVERYGTGKEGVLRVSGPICYTLAIYKDAHLADFQHIDVSTLGIRYSIFPDPLMHARTPNHYSHQKEPIILA